MKIKVKKKALVSVLLSLVMIMGLFFVPKVNAEDNVIDQGNTISFKNVQNDLEIVDGVILEADGQSKEINYPAGLITDNLDTIADQLTGTQTFQKAIVRDTENNTETPIARIGKYAGTTYYSLNDQQDIGIALTDNQKIVIVCASEYNVEYDYDPSLGNVIGPSKLFKGEDLNIAIQSNDYYHIDSVTWNGTKVEITENSKTTSIKIDGTQITENIKVKVTFSEDAKYRIIEKNAWITDEEHYAGYTDEENGGIQHGDICLDDDNEIIPDITPGNEVTFWLTSQSNSGIGQPDWYLNMLKFNGENINVPTNYNLGTYATTVLSNGSTVTVTLIKEGHRLSWKEDKWPTRRTVYEINISAVKENINIEGNFKASDSREMIITGLEGIQKVGAASEKINGKPIIGYEYYYGLQANDGDTVYTAYYNDEGSLGFYGKYGEAFNIYLYSVKAGYNPYTVDVNILYDGKEQNPGDVINDRLQSTDKKWITVDEIAERIPDLGNYRYFIYDDYNWLVDVKNNGYTHGIVLKESSSYNQLLRLTAHPYEYQLVFSLNGGSADLGEDYTSANGLYAYNKIYTLANGSVDAYMPNVKPTKDGNVFVGWKLYKDGKAVSNKIYSPNEAFAINETNIEFSEGDIKSDTGHTFTFVAQWEDIANSDQTAGIYLEVYKEVENVTEIKISGKYYEPVGNKTLIDYGTVGSSTFFLNLSSKNPDSSIYTPNTTDSKRYISKIIDEMDSNYNIENNTFKIYYDLKDYDLTIKKDAVGEYADLTRKWNIKVTLKYSNGNPIGHKSFGNEIFTNEKGEVTLSLKDNEEFKFENLNINDQYSIEEVGVPSDYVVTYKINNQSFSSLSNQSLSKDTTVTVINTMNDESIDIPDTNVPTSGAKSEMNILAIGSLGIVGIVVLMWYWRKKHV